MKRNTLPMRMSLRCGAKTRGGTPCRAPAVAGKERCRMHGGAKGSGAPKGNRNAWKTGLHTAEEKEMRRRVRDYIQRSREITEKF